MRNKVLTQVVVLVICAPSMWAQNQPQQSTADKSSAPPPGQEVLEGCLQRSRLEYALTDKDGVLHHLSGGKNMKQYVGHEVELYGENSIRTIDTTPPGAASSATEQRVFRVKSVKDLGTACGTSSQ